jgi:translin
MRDLEQIADSIQVRLDEKDTVREIAIKSARAIIRLSGHSIRGMHKGHDVGTSIGEAMEEEERLRSLLQEHQEIWSSGIVQDALQELAEAAIVLSIVKGDDMPTPEELDLPPTTYLMGFADAIGELRRFSLEALRQGRMEDAEAHLDLMEDMFLVIMRFDYPDAIVSIRRKQDVARSILEKTRGDVAVAVSSARLEKRIAELDRKMKNGG